MKKVLLFFLITLFGIFTSCSEPSKQELKTTSKPELKSEYTILKIASTIPNEGIEFEILSIEGDQPATEPLKIVKQNTPFELKTSSYSFIAIVRSDNPDEIESTLISYDSEDKELGKVTGKAPRSILQKYGDKISFNGI